MSSLHLARSVRAHTRRLAQTIVVLSVLTACGGGDKSTGPTDTTKPYVPVLTSIELSPVNAALAVPGTVQLTATPRDARGQVMTGQTVAWTTSAPAVATVSQSGLVTAVSGGTAIVTASIGSIQAQSSITVTLTNEYGPVVARGTIGSAGGTVGNDEIAVTIPAGAFSTTLPITLVRDTVLPDAYAAQRASPRYAIDGMPRGQVVSVRVRIKTTGTVQGATAIMEMEPGFAKGDSIGVALGLTLREAIDSSGYLVATIPLAGRPASWGSTALRALPRIVANEAAADLLNLKADALFAAAFNLSHQRSASSRFDVWGFNSIDAQMAAKVQRAATLMEQAQTKLVTEQGFSIAHRASWPMQILVETRPPNELGAFIYNGPFPFDQNKTYIAFAATRVNDAEFPGTVIHEYFHFIQEGFLVGKGEADYHLADWISETSSSWVEEQHPANPTPYSNLVARSWKDSLYGGLSNVLVANSGYGKAPMLKYISKQWGNAKVKEIWTAVQGGVHPVTAILNAAPETPSQWWPNALSQQLGGSLYPWTVAQIIPRARFELDMLPGRAAYASPAQYPLGATIHFLRRDTAMFGPKFQFPVFLDTASMGKARLLVFEKPAAATHFRPIAGRDTVFIPGNRLQTTDSIILVTTPIEAVAPYNTMRIVRFRTDLHLPDGDWYVTKVANVNDGFHYACDRPGDSMRVVVDENATSVWQFLSSAGTWKRQAAPSFPATYVWTVDPALVDSLARMQMVLEATMRESGKDTVYAQARIRWNPSTAALNGRAGAVRRSAVGGGSLWWLLVPVGLVPLAVTRRGRRVLPAVGAAMLLFFVSCDVGVISLQFDETLEYSFTKVRFTADPNDNTAPLMELNLGSGKSTLNTLRSEYWSYIRNPAGEKTDSVRSVCTGSGTSTYTPSQIAYPNGVVPPGTPSVRASVERMDQVLGVHGYGGARRTPPLK